jgi:bifunctional non-homologous end joining protein LigD
MTDKIVIIEGKKLKLTNLEKELWPGISKLDLINYFDEMAEYILPYLKNRALSMHRFPDGINGEAFFQKNVEDLAPDWATTRKIKDDDGKVVEYLVCNDKATLIYLANLACIELHPWLSKIDDLKHPDFLVLDLDPEDVSFDKVVDVALATKKVLDKLDIFGYIKTSGARGIHIFINVDAKYTFDQVKDFAEILARLINKEIPEITSLERLPEKRQHKVYIDWLQNAEAQTVVAPYSPRPKPDAPVSTPLEWKELNSKLDPKDFTIKNIQARLKAKGDLFKKLLSEKPVDIIKIISQYKNS